MSPTSLILIRVWITNQLANSTTTWMGSNPLTTPC